MRCIPVRTDALDRQGSGRGVACTGHDGVLSYHRHRDLAPHFLARYDTDTASHTEYTQHSLRWAALRLPTAK